ncbi:MAG: YchJ family protein [Marinobacter vinifirmus]
MSDSNDGQICPCGGGQVYSACCGRWHAGAPAPSPEALMRSRFTAFVTGDSNYLLATWHPDTRPESLSLDGSPEWTALQIFSAGEQGAKGLVHFRAIYRTGSGWGYLEEHSDFVKEGGHWFYVAGETSEGTLKPGRNEPCPCGSGRKYKSCCLNG